MLESNSEGRHGDSQPLNLPSVRQTLDFTCGAACFDSMFRYFRGWSPGEMHFAEELGTLRLGYTAPESIVTLAASHGFESAMEEDAALSDIEFSLARGEVVFVTWWDEDAGHYSLVKHLDATHITLMDPWKDRETSDHRLPLTFFSEMWGRRGSRIIRVSST